jgi:hypothetical protein
MKIHHKNILILICFKVVCVCLFSSIAESRGLFPYFTTLHYLLRSGSAKEYVMLWLWLMRRKRLWPIISMCFVWCGKPQARQSVPHPPPNLTWKSATPKCVTTIVTRSVNPFGPKILHALILYIGDQNYFILCIIDFVLLQQWRTHKIVSRVGYYLLETSGYWGGCWNLVKTIFILFYFIIIIFLWHDTFYISGLQASFNFPQCFFVLNVTCFLCLQWVVSCLTSVSLNKHSPKPSTNCQTSEVRQGRRGNRRQILFLRLVLLPLFSNKQ